MINLFYNYVHVVCDCDCAISCKYACMHACMHAQDTLAHVHNYMVCRAYDLHAYYIMQISNDDNVNLRPYIFIYEEEVVAFIEYICTIINYDTHLFCIVVFHCLFSFVYSVIRFTYKLGD